MTKDRCYDWQHLFLTYKSITDTKKIVVEIGSSTVERTNDLAKYCKKLFGVEKFSERIPSNSKFKNTNIKYINGDWNFLGKYFLPNSIDIIIASHVIEHVEYDVKCINESYKVLRKGGYLLFNTPNRKRMVRVIIELFSGERKFPYLEHVREYTRDDLIDLIKKTNFSIKTTRISGLVLGIHGMGIRFFLKNVPYFLDNYSNFWEVLIQK